MVRVCGVVSSSGGHIFLGSLILILHYYNNIPENERGAMLRGEHIWLTLQRLRILTRGNFFTRPNIL
jgi:hypothetical protein